MEALGGDAGQGHGGGAYGGGTVPPGGDRSWGRGGALGGMAMGLSGGRRRGGRGALGGIRAARGRTRVGSGGGPGWRDATGPGSAAMRLRISAGSKLPCPRGRPPGGEQCAPASACCGCLGGDTGPAAGCPSGAVAPSPVCGPPACAVWNCRPAMCCLSALRSNPPNAGVACCCCVPAPAPSLLCCAARPAAKGTAGAAMAPRACMASSRGLAAAVGAASAVPAAPAAACPDTAALASGPAPAPAPAPPPASQLLPGAKGRAAGPAPSLPSRAGGRPQKGPLAVCVPGAGFSTGGATLCMSGGPCTAFDNNCSALHTVENHNAPSLPHLTHDQLQVAADTALII
jgi:hypothetical protein